MTTDQFNISNFMYPIGMEDATKELVGAFATKLAFKLRKAELKYGFSDSWKLDNWEEKCKEDLYKHLDKGDPIDVAAYCAFMWYHGWDTKKIEGS